MPTPSTLPFRTSTGTEADDLSTSEPTTKAHVSHGATGRLAVYGSLAPGRPNHHQLHDLAGRWIGGTVRGQLCHEGWGAELGYPGLVLDPGGPTVGVQVFESPDLADHWTRLDEFEGPGYRREVTAVSTAEGELLASIYVITPNEPQLSSG